MDTSPLYIKMCEQAQEIQNQRKKDVYVETMNNTTFKGFYMKVGDFVILNNCNKEVKVLGFQNPLNSSLNRKYKTDFDLIWLPRQDQLQEMWIEEEEVDYHHKLQSIFHFSWETPNPFNNKGYKSSPYTLFSSMEQLWLAFIMKRNYDKIWNSEKEEWEEIN
jgi:hypothetical protein